MPRRLRAHGNDTRLGIHRGDPPYIALGVVTVVVLRDAKQRGGARGNDHGIDALGLVHDASEGDTTTLARNIGDAQGNPDYAMLERVVDEQNIDYVVLARYMRVLPAELCWKFAGGRIINLHHGLLPSFPGFRPYEDAYQHHMLCFGATIHFIVPELDAGNQIIYQGAFSVLPGTSLADIKRLGESDHEPNCLVEGLRRVIDREVELHFHRVARIQ